ncbi:MAG: AlkZ family DNA glycosylase [Ferruginibacter sp.]|nr:AlkZ family DNA glycosylase [Cytophagales bacterium]
MTTRDITNCRLVNQQIAETKFKAPPEIVTWLGALQAQEYAMAKWAIGLRLPGSKEADVETAFNNGAILRTHLLRPTWHFVTPADIRWLLALTAPRVHAVNAYWYRKFELDSSVFKRSADTLAKTLRGGKQLTRTALKSALEAEKIFAAGLRLGYLLMRAELDGLICSGPRQGKQFTYALLDESVPVTKPFDREEALAELTRRYFASRGPATLADFAYWSGLTVKEAKAGVATLPPHFVREVVDGQDYVFVPTASGNHGEFQTAFLLPDYDEYGMSYKNRSALFDSEANTLGSPGGNTAYDRVIIIDGVIAGTWRRTIKNNAVAVETTSFASLSKTKQRAVANAVKQYRSFVGKAPEE